MATIIGYGTNHSFTGLKPMEIERAAAGAGEVEIDILYCGVCHSDIHQAENDWSNTIYPCVPGHEIVGRVRAVGDGVTRHAVGDLVGVGCMVDSCGRCASCQDSEENYCESANGFLATYNGPMKAEKQAGVNIYGRDNTFGGYSAAITVKESFVLKIPEGIPVERAAPILCAGVTTFSPLRHWGVQPGSRVGVVGMGGLGDMAVKLAVAMGAEVHGFTTSKDKAPKIAAMGATPVVEDDKDTYASLASHFDLIVSTIPKGHKVDAFLPLLKRDGAYVAVGAVEPMPGHDHSMLVMSRKSIAGSLIGGIAETQEVLDFCAEHGIAPDVEVIAMQDINDAWKKLKAGGVEGRFVIDMSTIETELK